MRQPVSLRLQWDFFNVPNVIAEAEQPFVEQVAVHQLRLNAVMLLVFFENNLVFREFGFGEVVASAVADAEGEADFAAVAVAEAGFIAVGGEVKRRALEGHGADARLPDAVHGEMAFVFIAVVLDDEVEHAALLYQRQRHDAPVVFAARLVAVVDVEPAVLVEGAANGVQHVFVCRRRQ